jgi:hypothetical protein
MNPISSIKSWMEFGILFSMFSKKFSPKFSTKKVAMEHKVTFKTPDGTLQEKMFDNFNEFADTIEEVATGFYAGIKPEISVETIYDNMTRKEKVTYEESSESRRMEFLGEDSPAIEK